MRPSRIPQSDLFTKELHKFSTPQRMTTAVVLLKALLVEAVRAPPSTVIDGAMSQLNPNGAVVTEEHSTNDQNNA